MRTQIITLTALAIGAMSMATFSSTAQAGYMDGARVVKIGHVHKHKKFKRFHKRHKFFHHGGHFGGFYGRPCRSFFNKAKWTGSRYWWIKYNRCMNRFYWDY